MSDIFPITITTLAEQFHQLPGIGPKTAYRLALYLLSGREQVARALAHAMHDAIANVKICSVCYNLTGSDPCPICSDPERDHSQICVVEQPLDASAIERTGEYQGVYRVLHGAISPVEGITPDDLRINELLARVQTGETKEILLATTPTLEGGATNLYLRRGLGAFNGRITELAIGLPMGGGLQYVDEMTLTRAIQGRK